jgi:lactoylglutathione lyase
VVQRFKRIDHVALHVSDLQRSIEFYEKHFAFHHYFEHAAAAGHRIAYLRLGDTVLELTHSPGGSSMSGFHFCLEVENFAAAVTDLQTGGIEMLRAPHDTPARQEHEAGWRRAVFRGPDGEQIELRGK